MFLNSVVLILQEILEAALLVSVLMVFSRLDERRPYWLLTALSAGFAGSLLLSLNMANVSEWFDYVGQEVVNASMQYAITLLLALFAFSMSGDRSPGRQRLVTICMVGSVAFSLTRENAEVFIYIEGVLSQPSHLQPTLTGAGIGAGIGISVGILLYYSLFWLPRRWITSCCLLLLALIAGNMSSQATLLLTQADWLPPTAILWDSGHWLPENSIPGHLLYALVGYEATPSVLQGVAYAAGIILVALMAWLGSRQRHLKRQPLLADRKED